MKIIGRCMIWVLVPISSKSIIPAMEEVSSIMARAAEGTLWGVAAIGCDAVFFHHVLEIGAFEAGLAGSLADVPVVLLQGMENKVFLHPGNGFLPDFLLYPDEFGIVLGYGFHQTFDIAHIA